MISKHKASVEAQLFQGGRWSKLNYGGPLVTYYAMLSVVPPHVVVVAVVVIVVVLPSVFAISLLFVFFLVFFSYIKYFLFFVFRRDCFRFVPVPFGLVRPGEVRYGDYIRLWGYSTYANKVSRQWRVSFSFVAAFFHCWHDLLQA